MSELKDLIRKYGGTPRGSTVAQLQDELEHLVGSGGGDVVPGTVSDEDLDEIFSQAGGGGDGP